MAYNNPYFYNRDSSIDEKYKYVLDLSIYKPTYESSVNFKSRYNSIETVDNAIKILPSSENNLIATYNLRFFLDDEMSGNLLKTIEIAGGYKVIKFYDPSGLYKDFIGLAENYSINKNSSNLNEINIAVSAFFKSPLLNWKTSSFFNVSDLDHSESKKYLKNQFVYNNIGEGIFKNKIDHFWFAKEDNEGYFDVDKWTRDFNYFPKFPFQVENKFDFHQLNYKNSFIQNIKHKDNSNTLKQYRMKFQSIDDNECLSILFFLEKKCGYRRFIYNFPIFFKSKKVFICPEWTHTFKYKNCHDIEVVFMEDPSPNIFLNFFGYDQVI
jgi:phage-related protein